MMLIKVESRDESSSSGQVIIDDTMSDTMKNSFNQINKPAIVPEYFSRLFMIRKRIIIRITHNIHRKTISYIPTHRT